MGRFSEKIQPIEKRKKTGNRPFFQAKLTVNRPGDIYEQEADAMADKVVSMDSSNLSTGIQAKEDNALMRSSNKASSKVGQNKPSLSGTHISDSITSGINRHRGAGNPLPRSTRSRMEQGFGSNFGQVRIHHDAESDHLNRTLQARAFTVGPDIFFKQGEFSPNTREGQRLLAHELTHVIQQGEEDRFLLQRDEDEEEELVIDPEMVADEEAVEEMVEEEEEAEAESPRRNRPFQFNLEALPPALQITIMNWMFEANTSEAALQFTHENIRTRLSYEYGDDITLGIRDGRAGGSVAFNPHDLEGSVRLNYDRFRLGSSYNFETGQLDITAGYGAKLRPMPFELAAPFMAGGQGAANILGNIGGMGDPGAFYRAHQDDVEGVMGAVRALETLTDEDYSGFGVGLRFTYNPETGILIYGGLQWSF